MNTFVYMVTNAEKENRGGIDMIGKRRAEMVKLLAREARESNI